MSLRGWIKSGPLSSLYAVLRAITGSLLRALYWAWYSLWPDATRHALSRSIPLRDLKKIVQLKLSRDPYFFFAGQKLGYSFHSYNNFGLTERRIEIPIIRHYVERLAPQHILEIGNVTQYYYDALCDLAPFDHKTVVDKYEKTFGIVRSDLADFRPGKQYDFIFSISTFEHMDSDRGFNPDYVPGRSRRSSHAADNLHYVADCLLADGGTFVLTAPIGYSEEWDRTFYSGELETLNVASFQSFGFEKQGEFRWRQVDVARGRADGRRLRPFPEMDFIVILEIRK